MPERIVVITGASDGIGAAAARQLSRAGDRVVIVGRNPAKTAAVAAELGADFLVADFARLEQVHALAATLRERYPRIDVLANNAGGIMGARADTVDGHELTFQVNHLAPFLLTTLLIDRLVASEARVITTSSTGNKLFGNLKIDDLDARSAYSPNSAYGNAKLANILFTRELDRRYGARGISAASFHPGVVATSFAAGSTSPMRFLYRTFLKRTLLSPDRGADTLVWLATAEPGTDWVRGEYYDRRKVAVANKQSYDAELATQLWERSAAMVERDGFPVPR
ncbi:SDR family NAD(P)-dependent oxidoreductase [Pengzhenrongella sicca]|uniref:SDR family NAD(P)-dependent oxidoreductase n=1 Tax=Pengzhenrongella sicca TaxID=2819238 RepID=A0A8A4ZCJ6_9MICO|nr:SDR family NAD(P)-dependent oxidoreductase [Pengzhenrongella sicca]QTE28217.1 SDR family NAD(P)-dependent oxidoreductase [Pengzhenrongella sicca]